MFLRIVLCLLAVCNAALAATVIQRDVGTCSRPARSAVGPDGSVWIPCSSSNARLIRAQYNPGGAITLDNFIVPSLSGSIAAVIFGPDGLLWFVASNVVGKYDTVAHTATLYTLIGASANVNDIALGGDGNIWVNKFGGGASMVKVLPNGQMQEFFVPGGNARRPVFIGAGADGNIWYTDELTTKVGRVTPAGVITEFDIGSTAEGIVAGADGNMWATSDNGLARITPAGQVTVFPYPAGYSTNTFGIVSAPDGTLWYADANGAIGQAATTGVSSYLNLPQGSAPLYIAVRPSDGAVFFMEYNAQRIGVIAPATTTPSDTSVIEFYNDQLNHYFITSSAVEAAAIDGGAAGPGWSRTGQTWRAWLAGPLPTAALVCRFYGTPDINPATGLRRGPNSHFYTLEPAECAAVRQDPGWTYEPADKYWMLRPTSNTAAGCKAGTTPIYRAYNQRFAFNDSNHRYMTSLTLYNQMLALGWSGEGVVMCAPG